MLAGLVAAPEVISASRKRYDGRQADVWSCGVMLYVMLFHAYPFERPGDPPGPRGFAKVRLPHACGSFSSTTCVPLLHAMHGLVLHACALYGLGHGYSVVVQSCIITLLLV